MAQHRSEILDLLSTYATQRAKASEAACQERQVFTATLRANLEAAHRVTPQEARAGSDLGLDRTTIAPVSPGPVPEAAQHLRGALAKLAASVALIRNNMHRLGVNAGEDTALAAGIRDPR